MRKLAFVILITLGYQCSAIPSEDRGLVPLEQELIGEYYYGDPGYWGVRLVLSPGGEFSARSYSCTERSVAASGNWRMEDGYVAFDSNPGSGAKSFLPAKMKIQHMESELVLSPYANDSALAGYGPEIAGVYLKGPWDRRGQIVQERRDLLGLIGVK
jgi:hypothetical protein